MHPARAVLYQGHGQDAAPVTQTDAFRWVQPQ